ncbi:SPOR domain-containing protein [Candidatus Saganbacteria bacterium]|nr:SPOR domain-containing protein [Candidatus Saganbacteria bacterium]
MKIIKNLFLLTLLLAVIILSFWVSFKLSKNLLVSAKKTTTADLLTIKPADMDKLAANPATQAASSEKQVKISFEVETVPAEPDVKTNADLLAPKIIIGGKQKQAVYRVQSGLFSLKANANTMVQKIKNLGYDAQFDSAGKYFRVFVPAESLNEARLISRTIRAKGYEAIISHANRQAGRK